MPISQKRLILMVPLRSCMLRNQSSARKGQIGKLKAEMLKW